ncbi:MAG TPA: twin-arginine translocase subunit TatC [bacterium]|nr:twin-arginine translocase subunit TatC [bacterium]
MTFLEHLEDLRKCLLVSIGMVFGTTVLAFFFSDWLLKIFSKPIQGIVKLHTSSFAETFGVSIKLSVICGLFISFPVVLHQLWRFVSPGLYNKERKYLVRFIIWAWISFIIGGFFAYFAMIPVALQMMVRFTPAEIENTWFVSKYISLVMIMMLSCGLLFDTPLVILLLSRLGIINPRKLSKYRGYALLASFIIGAVLTPPDPITQTMLAVPLYVLFEISIWLAVLLGYGTKEETST